MNTVNFLICHSSREPYFITLNLLTESWVLCVLLSLIFGSKMDETLPVHRDADIISGVFCRLAKFVLIGFFKLLYPEKEDAAFHKFIGRIKT